MNFVMGYVQQGVGRVVEGAVVGAGGFVGDVVNGAGNTIEATGRGVGNSMLHLPFLAEQARAG